MHDIQRTVSGKKTLTLLNVMNVSLTGLKCDLAETSRSRSLRKQLLPVAPPPVLYETTSALYGI